MRLVRLRLNRVTMATTADSLSGGPGSKTCLDLTGHLAMRLKEQGSLQLPFFPRANQPVYPHP